jgi:hypothetical protein
VLVAATGTLAVGGGNAKAVGTGGIPGGTPGVGPPDGAYIVGLNVGGGGRAAALHSRVRQYRVRQHQVKAY